MPVTELRREFRPKRSINASHPTVNPAHTTRRASVGRTALAAMTTIETTIAAM